MNKRDAKAIAEVLIAKSGENFDHFAFDDCDDLITEDEAQKVINEIQEYCGKIKARIEKRYGVHFESTTRDVVMKILYED